MAQDLPPNAGHIPMGDLMQMGLFSGFRSRWATLLQDPTRTINQVTPGQSSTAGNQQSQGNVSLPPDLDLPVSGSQGSGLPADLPLPGPKLPSFSVQYSSNPFTGEVGVLSEGELARALRSPHRENTGEVRDRRQAIVYIWSDRPFDGEIATKTRIVELETFYAEGIHWARLTGSSSTLAGSTLTIRADGKTRTIKFTEEVR